MAPRQIRVSMVGDGPTQFSVGGDDPFRDLLQQVQQAAEGVYDVLGEMGRSPSGNVVYLAREMESGHLVALKLTRAGSEEEFSLEVVRTLDSSVPGLENTCPECRAVLADLDRFCVNCGADLTGGPAPESGRGAGELLEAVKQATAGEYDILGQMSRTEGGGTVFFARDRARNKLVALRLKKEAGADASQAAYSIGETQILRPLAAELGRTEIFRPTPSPPAPVVPQPSAGPPPVPSRPVEPAAAPPAPPSAPRGKTAGSSRRLPPKVLWGVGGVVGVVALAVIALSGSDESAPPPASDTTAAAVAPDTAAPVLDTMGAAEPSAVQPPAAVVVESATVRLGLQLPAGARVTIDGAGVRGRSIRLAPGSHTLAVTAAGYEPVTTQVTLNSGQEFRWVPVLKKEVAVNQATPPPPPPVAMTCARAYSRSDWERAATLCTDEANAGKVDAQRMLGRMRELGNGVSQDRVQAANWYEKAGNAGDRESQVRLGFLYRSGAGVRRDEKESARWFMLAAQQGDPIAQLELGVAVENGDGVRKNEAEAAKLYRASADAGNATALWRLGRLYERGRGLQKNEAEAAHYYEQAAGKGDAEAMFLLAKLYKDGRGVEKSPTRAYEWFQKAAAAGHREAAEEARKLGPPK